MHLKISQYDCHLKPGVQPTSETVCISNIPQAVDSVQRNDIILKEVILAKNPCCFLLFFVKHVF
jgi:hypothetical protein